MKEYLHWVQQDTTRHHTMVTKIDKYISDMNQDPHRRRLRDAAAIRSAKVLHATEEVGRELIGRWKQAIPLDKWSECRGSEPVPGEEYQGVENICGRPTKVFLLSSTKLYQ